MQEHISPAKPWLLMAAALSFKDITMPSTANPAPSSTPIPSSTIVIARDNHFDKGMEIFMVVRHHQIDFASGALVFPGGKVSCSDSNPTLRDRCNGQEDWSDDALGLGVAAIREAFEESGILLARKAGETKLINNTALNTLNHYRSELEQKEITMEVLTHKANLTMAMDELNH